MIKTRDKLFITTAIALIVITVQGYSATIYRTGFESGTGSPAFPDASGSDMDINAGYNGWSGGQSGVHVITSTNSHNGTQSYRASGWGSSQPNISITTQTNKDIYLTFWIKCASNGEYTYLQSKQSGGGSMSEIKISTDADIEVSADNVWVSAGSFDVGVDWFAMQIKWIWNGVSGKYDQQTIYAANIGDMVWTTVGTKATRFDQPDIKTIMITKETGVENAFIDDFTISDTSIVPDPEQVIIYETGFEAGTGSPAFPDASGGDMDINVGYGGWTGGQSNVHVIASEEAQRSKQSLKATGWGTSQPINTFSAQSGKDIYLRVWCKNVDPGSGKVGYLQMNAQNNATLSAIRFSTTDNIEVNADNVWVSAGSFNINTDWFAMMIQYQWNGSLQKYDRQTIYAANQYEKDWTILGSAKVRFSQPDIGRLLYTKVAGTESCYIDDMTISDTPIKTGIPPLGAFMVIR